jgi:hypothetical protein
LILKKILKTSLFILIATTVFALPVMSYSPFLDQTVEIYNVRARCELCHFGPQLNPFGQDFKNEWKISHDLIKSLKSIEMKDSDGDGFLNIDEIKAMSLPGDKLSIPEKNNQISMKKSH